MSLKYVVLHLVLAVFLLAGGLPAAAWKPMTDSELINRSDLVAVGKIVWVENGEIGPRSVDRARILVQEVLKGDPSIVLATLSYPGRNKGVLLADGSFRPTRSPSDIFFDLNQEGIWFLKRAKSDKNAYSIDHPACFKPLFFKSRILKSLGK